MMQNININIDGLVQEILADLTGKTIGPPAVTKPVAEVGTVVKRAGEIVIDKRVVSLADIKGIVAGTSKLIVSPKSILTPSVKDEIRRRKIEIAVRLPETVAGRKTRSLWLAAQRPAVYAADSLKRLQADYPTTQVTFTSVAELLEEANRRLSEGRFLGVALTRQAASLLYQANRCDSLRAIPGYDPEQTAEDAAEIDANLLVLHPGRIPGTEIINLIRSLAF